MSKIISENVQSKFTEIFKCLSDYDSDLHEFVECTALNTNERKKFFYENFEDFISKIFSNGNDVTQDQIKFLDFYENDYNNNNSPKYKKFIVDNIIKTFHDIDRNYNYILYILDSNYYNLHIENKNKKKFLEFLFGNIIITFLTYVINNGNKIEKKYLFLFFILSKYKKLSKSKDIYIHVNNNYLERIFLYTLFELYRISNENTSLFEEVDLTFFFDLFQLGDFDINKLIDSLYWIKKHEKYTDLLEQPLINDKTPYNRTRSIDGFVNYFYELFDSIYKINRKPPAFDNILKYHSIYNKYTDTFMDIFLGYFFEKIKINKEELIFLLNYNYSNIKTTKNINKNFHMYF